MKNDCSYGACYTMTSVTILVCQLRYDPQKKSKHCGDLGKNAHDLRMISIHAQRLVSSKSDPHEQAKKHVMTKMWLYNGLQITV